jgi:hypothetical protein
MASNLAIAFFATVSLSGRRYQGCQGRKHCAHSQRGSHALYPMYEELERSDFIVVVNLRRDMKFAECLTQGLLILLWLYAR